MMAKCIGFPKGPCPGQTNRNPVWCDKCNQKRITHISAQMQKLRL